MGFGVWGLGVGVLGCGFGFWGLGSGVWGLGFGVWGLGFGATHEHTHVTMRVPRPGPVQTVPIGTVLNLRTTTSQKCEAVPRRARI